MFTTTGAILNEVVLEVCGLAYAAINRNQIPELLKAVAVLQQVDTRPENAADRPKHIEFKDAVSEAEATDWALGVVLRPMLEYNPDALYEDKDAAIAAAKKVAEDESGFLTKEQASDFEKIVRQIDDELWAGLVKEHKRAIVGRQFRPSKDMVEQAVSKLTAGKYSGDMLINYSDDGHLEVTIDAPYPLAFSFERQPNNLKFYRAGMVGLCDKLFEARTPQLATSLVMTDVYLGKFFEQAANPGTSQERSAPKSTKEEVVDEYAKRVQKEFGKEPEAQQEEQWKDLAILVDKDPQAFVRYVTENKENAAKFFKDNKGFTDYLKTDREQVYNALPATVIQVEPEII